MLSIDSTYIFHLINFIMLYLAFRYFFSEKIGKAIEDRRRIINSYLDEAAKAKDDSAKLKLEINQELVETKKRTLELISEAKQHAQQIKKEILDEALKIKMTIIEDGKKQLKSLEFKLKEELKSEAISLALKISEKILMDEINIDNFRIEKLKEFFN